MRTAPFAIACLFAITFAPRVAPAANPPTATGRSITMSNPQWKLFIPSTYVHRPGNVADLLVHFHGDAATYRNNAKFANLNTIIVNVEIPGLSGAYGDAFGNYDGIDNTAKFQQLTSEALTKVRAEADFADTLAWDKLGVSSFSAGYGAVREVLKSATHRNDIDVLIALDSLHASTAGDGTPLDSQVADYKTFATAAKNGTKTFLYSHSQVPTSGYESTSECAEELLQHVGITPAPINTTGLGTLALYRKAHAGNFTLWGATGSDGDSHLEHLRYGGEFLQHAPLAKVPEPAGAAVLGLLGLSLGRRRHRRRHRARAA